ncbi:GIY-YIG catalytic domain protein [Maioricimonas rarisocia]|uniref:GIY-YIG catalytic domain protein n=1 Tax=Maioricimonas rarisocia TaxID=2528026 RepID=A0A517Z9N4_9PLAN|nr:GIY-YIG nuclease family protein [Maioricimonas rarisocia]QDU39196.1 GIY-YIG catalytic domain protein [Maioricimonas rarisocia]
MTSPKARTIQIFLPFGEPRGIRIAEFTTRNIQTILIPRSDLVQAKSRSELDHVAVYFLFGESEEFAKPIVYIGQTEDVRKRLDHHNSSKDFWKTAVLGISRTQTFTQAHIRYLEWYCIQKAKEVNRYALDNDNTPGKPFVTAPMEADLFDAFEMLNVLMSTLGYPVFEPIVKSDAAAQFFLKGKEAEATGELVEDGFVVRAGAIGRKEITPSAEDVVKAARSKLLESGVLLEENGCLKLTQDFLFSSPSGAAETLLGRTANGWTEWKTAEGLTLHDVHRAEE